MILWRILTFILALSLTTSSVAQAFQWPAAYAATSKQTGTIHNTLLSDISTLNPLYLNTALELAMIGNTLGGPYLLYRDWLGSRSIKTEGRWNMFWAQSIEEIVPEQEYIVTVREGWQWSDGETIDVDDIIAAYTIMGDEAVEATGIECAYVDEEPVEVNKISQYSYRIRFPKAIINGLANKDCGTIPAHIYMPLYEAGDIAAIQALWGVDADIAEIVSGGPFIISEFSSGQRLVLERNPLYGQQVQAADGTPLPSANRIVVEFVQDTNATLARVITGHVDYHYPSDFDELAAIHTAINNGAIDGKLYANLGAGNRIDFITYNFNNSDRCKAAMFRDVRFRQAIAMMIDRQALVDAALGGIGTPAKGLSSSAAAPFDAAFIEEFDFNPEAGLELLAAMGFSEYDSEGVLINPETECRVAFDLQFNSGNARRSQEALVIAQTVAPYGVRITPREVAISLWIDSIVGDTDFDSTGKRSVDYDAQIWSLAGGDFDSPAAPNVLAINADLNAWNKSTSDVQAWEVELDALTHQMDETLDLEARVEVFNQRAALMREYLPLTPLIFDNFSFYTRLDNIWPEESLDAYSIENPYRPGNFMSLLHAR